ncbi:MAG: hypothetical protein AUJ82_07470 [Verrucomicrobia bacterium CG1_02_43_26]|nr:MAG: hypothetical protein AUJ82_07470 [Verrucomicrobia bacterium CG1_02_43_26]
MHSRSSEETIGYMATISIHLPKNALKSITFDNGLEFYDHQMLALKFNIPTYFCDPTPLMAEGGSREC